MHPASQIARRALADPAAIDVEDELDAPLHEDDAGIDGAQEDDEPVVPMFDEIVDDPALQFERHDFEQEYADGQQHDDQLVPSARCQNIAEDVAGHLRSTVRRRWPAT
jgi:hypothetical protein